MTAHRPRPNSPDQPKRCAIYTRKSTSEGLEQEFNSLDAQREACLEYIRRQPGWVALPGRYDDGGFTGANTERPAFAQLLADVDAGQVEIIVVYKIDRLSRSLIDFTKLIERLDASGASFVSITQNFSTATAMGRFTLNILMSFAEFEREMIRERTRDKLAAAKRAGHWVGGTVPLGYTTVAGKLVINEREAPIVREIFELYRQRRSAMEVARILNTRRAAAKRERKTKGVLQAPRPWSAADVYRVLKNQLYAGRTSIGAEVRLGNHPAIVDPAVVDETQELLRAGGAPRKAASLNPTYLLRDRLFCANCGALCTTASSRKNGVVRRYYRCSTRLKRGSSACTSGMIPAPAIEDYVISTIKDALETGSLAAQITAAMPARIAAARSNLDRTRAELPLQIASLVSDMQRQLESLDHLSGQARRAIEARLQRAGDALERAEARLLDGQRQLHRLDTAEADLGWISDCLTHFDRMWDLLTPTNQARLLRSIVHRVEVHEAIHQARVCFADLGDLLDTATYGVAVEATATAKPAATKEAAP